MTFKKLPFVSRVRKTSVQWDDVAGVLVECVVLPSFVDQSFDFRTRILQLHGPAHLAGGVGVVRRWRDTLFVMFGILKSEKKKSKCFFLFLDLPQYMRLFRNLWERVKGQLNLGEGIPCLGVLKSEKNEQIEMFQNLF